MNYKRLTKRTKHGIAVLDSGERFVLSCGGYATTKALNRLAELEDKIENGTLIEVESSCTEEELSRKLIDIEIQNMIRSLSVPGDYYSLRGPRHRKDERG